MLTGFIIGMIYASMATTFILAVELEELAPLRTQVHETLVRMNKWQLLPAVFWGLLALFSLFLVVLWPVVLMVMIIWRRRNHEL